jgi:hypothetical protein
MRLLGYIIRVVQSFLAMLLAASVPASQSVASEVLSFTGSFPVVGVSGSRSLSGSSLVVAQWLAYQLAGSVAGECRLGEVFVGCAEGADRVFRSALPCRVFQADQALGRGGFASRSAAVVAAVAAAGGCWVSFPGSACPVGLLPSASQSGAFCGSGSGSWASLALAIGRGVPSLLWLPDGVAAPIGWGLEALGRGWFVARPAAVQSSLF